MTKPIWEDPITHQPQTCVRCKLKYAIEHSISTGEALPADVFRALISVTADFLAHADDDQDALVAAFHDKLKGEMPFARRDIAEQRGEDDAP